MKFPSHLAIRIPITGIANGHSLGRSYRGAICDACLIKDEESVWGRCVRDNGREQERVVRVIQVGQRGEDIVCRVSEIRGWFPIKGDIVECIANRAYEVDTYAYVGNRACERKPYLIERAHTIPVDRQARPVERGIVKASTYADLARRGRCTRIGVQELPACGDVWAWF